MINKAFIEKVKLINADLNFRPKLSQQKKTTTIKFEAFNADFS